MLERDSDAGSLLRATGDNHRAWFFRAAAADPEGAVEKVDDVEVVVAAHAATIPFPDEGARIDAAVQWCRRRQCVEVGCWSLGADARLGVHLAARGFEWGWQPHWMALDLRFVPDEQPGHPVSSATASTARDAPELPYSSTLLEAMGGRRGSRVRRLVAERDGRVVGQVALNVTRGRLGVGGIYSMGVVPEERRRGIGRALTLAVCRLARDLRCEYVVLNATQAGEPLYRGFGFESLGFGQTWWLFPQRVPQPTARQVALAEAAGLGDLERLRELRPRQRELVGVLPAGVTLAGFAILAGCSEAVEWLAAREPESFRGPVDRRGATALHLAAERGDVGLARLALAAGADPKARDAVWRATPLGWARRCAQSGVATLLEQGGRAMTQPPGNSAVF